MNAVVEAENAGSLEVADLDDLVLFSYDGKNLATTKSFIGDKSISTNAIKKAIMNAIGPDTEKITRLPKIVQDKRQLLIQLQSRRSVTENIRAGKFSSAHNIAARFDRIESLLLMILKKLD